MKISSSHNEHNKFIIHLKLLLKILPKGSSHRPINELKCNRYTYIHGMRTFYWNWDCNLLFPRSLSLQTHIYYCLFVSFFFLDYSSSLCFHCGSQRFVMKNKNNKIRTWCSFPFTPLHFRRDILIETLHTQISQQNVCCSLFHVSLSYIWNGQWNMQFAVQMHEIMISLDYLVWNSNAIE